MICSGAGLIYRNISDYEQQDALFRSNITESEVRYRRLERELPEFIIQNDRITDILQKANDTFLTDTTYQLSKHFHDHFISYHIQRIFSSSNQ